VSLLDEYGIETAALKQGIVEATGVLSEYLLEAEVASGLVEARLAAARAWFRTHGARVFFRIVLFLLVLLAFWFLAWVSRAVARRTLAKRHMKELSKDVLVTLIGRTIMAVGLLVAITQLGVQVGALLAGLGIAGFIVGFALQDTLANFASGLMILVYGPFDVGDEVEAGGVRGVVEKMNLVSTTILTYDNQLFQVPNNKVWKDVIRNVSTRDTRRVDMKFGIGNTEDVAEAESRLMDILTSHEQVLEEPPPTIRLHELGESSLNFLVQPWVRKDDYWRVYRDVTREVKLQFGEESFSIPFPQRDEHVH
jgi:small conductance mechanosensitive channel